ncbi:MAG: aspartate aminotransferase family protein [Hyphomicrobiales bacterium]|nr:aspartate aminotransferase family protein [Hyphomicrobiales bacterium]
MTRILHRRIEPALPVAVSGEGVFIRDSNGKDYLDASGGASVSCLGHRHPVILTAMRRQMDELEYAHTAFFTNDAAEALADDLVAHAPPGIGHVYLVSGGSEAIETALKLARQYFVEKGEPQRTQFVSRKQSFHGNTLGALSLAGNPRRRDAFEPMLFRSHLIDPCYAYRHQLDDEPDEAYGARAAQALEGKLIELGPETVIAFVAETVVGATAGAVTAAPGYFRAIREICDRYGVLLILDEVMSGMGRTGSLHACEQEGVVPDLLTAAKGLGGGYQPIGAVLMVDKIYDAFLDGSGSFRHGHTYIGHPIGCAAALAVQKVIREEHLLDNVVEQGERLRRQLTQRCSGGGNIGDIRGRGLFQAIEIVADRSTKKPFPVEARMAQRIHQAAMDRGLCVYPGSGTADGQVGDHILIAPPFIVEGGNIEAIVERLGDAIEVALDCNKAGPILAEQ